MDRDIELKHSKLPLLLLDEAIDYAVAEISREGNWTEESEPLVQYVDRLAQEKKRYINDTYDTRDINRVSSAEKKLARIEERLKWISRRVQEKANDLLLQKKLIGFGFLDGEPTIIPFQHWSGKIDWREYELIFQDFTYTKVRIIDESKLSPEERKLIRDQADICLERLPPVDPIKTGAAGRPSSMDILGQEMLRRAKNGSLGPTLKAAVEDLLIYLAKEYPKAPQPKQKTAENSLREIYSRLSN